MWCNRALNLRVIRAVGCDMDYTLVPTRARMPLASIHWVPWCGKPRSKAPTEKSQELDAKISPLAKASGEMGNPTWGPLMRAGNDKSLFARQVERYADVYTSRVSNFLSATPFAYLRAARGSLPHDD